MIDLVTSRSVLCTGNGNWCRLNPCSPWFFLNCSLCNCPVEGVRAAPPLSRPALHTRILSAQKGEHTVTGVQSFEVGVSMSFAHNRLTHCNTFEAATTCSVFAVCKLYAQHRKQEGPLQLLQL